jgi:hypothetical protein
MGRIIRPPVEEARRLFEGKQISQEVDVGISFIEYGYATRRDGSVRIMEPGPPFRMRCYRNGKP